MASADRTYRLRLPENTRIDGFYADIAGIRMADPQEVMPDRHRS